MRMFYMPWHFERKRDDTATLTDKQYRLYDAVIERYWLRDCDIDVDTLFRAVRCTRKEFDALMSEVPTFENRGGQFFHGHTLEEYQRTIDKSESARKAAKSKGKHRLGEVIPIADA